MNYKQNQKINQVKESTLVVGIDIGSTTQYARAFDWRGIELGKVFKFSNSREGFENFKDWMQRLQDKYKKPDTNMVCSLMCARELMEKEEDIIVSYGDINYGEEVFRNILQAQDDISVIVDDGWYEYWSERCENPLDDAETLMFDEESFLTEIGQKTTDLSKVQSQYIGLMRFRGAGLKAVLDISSEAKSRSEQGISLWRTDRNYSKMYMTDLLQGLIDEDYKLRAVHINRGWFEIDDSEDLKVVESKIQ